MRLLLFQGRPKYIDPLRRGQASPPLNSGLSPRNPAPGVFRATLFALLALGCAPKTRIVVPPDALREWAYTPGGESRATRHVIRMSDGSRDWEVEFPDVATGYEVRIPLRGAPGAPDRPESTPARLTAADREMLEERALSPAGSGDGRGEPAGRADGGRGELDAAERADAKGARARPAAAGRAARPSYLGGIARVRELYRTRNYELALIDCVDLEREYPNDPKLLSMKGSIYRKLGKPRLARESWEKALALDPDNTTVADALRELAGETEGR
jgi:tetratricopeptide (TPR) repeat protein